MLKRERRRKRGIYTCDDIVSTPLVLNRLFTPGNAAPVVIRELGQLLRRPYCCALVLTLSLSAHRLTRLRLGHAAGPRADDTGEHGAEFVWRTRLNVVAVSADCIAQLCAAGVVT